MKVLELLKSNEPLLQENGIEEKKVRGLSIILNQLMIEMNKQIESFEEFNQSQLDGTQSNIIIIAKSLAEYFKNNKYLKVEAIVDSLKKVEIDNINKYYSTKNKLLDTIKALIKESNKAPIISNFDLYNDDFVKCEPGHEIVILGDRNCNILITLLQELDNKLIVSGNFDKNLAQEVNYNTASLDKNVILCNNKNMELNSQKSNHFKKIDTIINRLKEIGEKVVAFYTYKEALSEIGCSQKGIKDYEHELSKAYIPLKKTLSKELNIDLEDICNVNVNETNYPSYNLEDETSNDTYSNKEYYSYEDSYDNIFTEKSTENKVSIEDVFFNDNNEQNEEISNSSLETKSVNAPLNDTMDSQSDDSYYSPNTSEDFDFYTNNQSSFHNDDENNSY